MLELKEKPAKTSNIVSINTGIYCVLCGKSGATDNFCFDCAADSRKFKVPKPHEFFDDEKQRDVDFLLAPEIARIGRKLLKFYKDDFSDLRNAEIDYFWKKKGGTKNGRSKLGECKKPSGLEKYYSQKDFLIWIAADNCWSCNYFQFTALTFHELKHATGTEDGGYDLIGHDLEVFNREIEVFGHWKNDIALTAKAFQKVVQPRMF